VIKIGLIQVLHVIIGRPKIFHSFDSLGSDSMQEKKKGGGGVGVGRECSKKNKECQLQATLFHLTSPLTRTKQIKIIEVGQILVQRVEKSLTLKRLFSKHNNRKNLNQTNLNHHLNLLQFFLGGRRYGFSMKLS
jgi:hypothetical protein